MKKTCVVVYLSMLSLWGCSSEETTSTDSGLQTTDQQSRNRAVSVPKQSPGVEANESEISNQETQTPQLPTRSELRVLSEDAKVTEIQAKEVIEEFDDNLADPGQRKEAEDKFKQMLPEYKQKMLLLGKSKLQQEK